VQPRQGERDAVLPEIVADRHLAAEAVAPVRDGHDFGIVVESMDEHGHAQPGPSKGVGHAAFVAEIGEADEDAVDAFGILAEQVGAFCASSMDSTAPNFVALKGSVMVLMPSFSRVARISLRPVSHRCAGKKPQLWQSKLQSTGSAALDAWSSGRWSNKAGGQGHRGGRRRRYRSRRTTSRICSNTIPSRAASTARSTARSKKSGRRQGRGRRAGRQRQGHQGGQRQVARGIAVEGAGRGPGHRIHRPVHRRGEGQGPHHRRREEGHHFRPGQGRLPHGRHGRERRQIRSRPASHHFQRLLHDELPGAGRAMCCSRKASASKKV
jgi:hypothetical protein